MGPREGRGRRLRRTPWFLVRDQAQPSAHGPNRHCQWNAAAGALLDTAPCSRFDQNMRELENCNSFNIILCACRQPTSSRVGFSGRSCESQKCTIQQPRALAQRTLSRTEISSRRTKRTHTSAMQCNMPQCNATVLPHSARVRNLVFVAIRPDALSNFGDDGRARPEG